MTQRRLAPGLLLLFLLFLGTSAYASSVTDYLDRSNFNAAVGPRTIDDFGQSYAFPITSGLLNAFTNLGTASGGPILPGLIQPGVSYSTPIGTGYFFNIDSGGGFDGGFLDGGLGNFSPLTVSFTNPISAFGFDTNNLMGNSFVTTINFTSGPSQSQTLTVNGDSFFGFQSSGSDITSVEITGDGSSPFTFAVDNFTVTNGPGTSSVPEPSELLLLASGLIGLSAILRRRSLSTSQSL